MTKNGMSRGSTDRQEGIVVAKDKKKKKDKKPDKKAGDSMVAKAAAPKKAAKRLQTLSQNPIVADVIAAALVSMAAALKDSDKARRLASDAGDELNALSKAGAKQGSAMWDLALDIGRRALQTLSEETGKPKSGGK